MDLVLLGRGLVLGFAIAAPVGPVGLLCIRATLLRGRSFGLASGLGAASADALYGLAGALGLGALSGFLVARQSWLQLAGGLFLGWLGLRAMLDIAPPAPPAEGALSPAGAAGRSGLGQAYLSTLALTLTNPITILAFTAAFAGIGYHTGTPLQAGSLVLGVFLGSAAWWLLLSTGVSLLRGRFSPAALAWLNRFAGLALLGFGLAMVVRAIQ